MMKVIGITGPSGSGKSRISTMLRDKGYPVIDVDVVAKDLRPKFINNIKELFGPEYIKDGVVDSKKLALLVFNDRIQLEKLNHLMFPVILEEMQKFIKLYGSLPNVDYLFFDIAVLFHSGAEKLFDHIILVTASRLTRLERLIKLRKVPVEIAMAQVDSVFMTQSEISRCSLTLVNEGAEEDVHTRLMHWLNMIKVGSGKMSDKIEPVSPIPSQINISAESRNRDLQNKNKKAFSEKLDKAIKERKKKLKKK